MWLQADHALLHCAVLCCAVLLFRHHVQPLDVLRTRMQADAAMGLSR
jgi:hypothetical protein